MPAAPHGHLEEQLSSSRADRSTQSVSYSRDSFSINNARVYEDVPFLLIAASARGSPRIVSFLRPNYGLYNSSLEPFADTVSTSYETSTCTFVSSGPHAAYGVDISRHRLPPDSQPLHRCVSNFVFVLDAA